MPQIDGPTRSVPPVMLAIAGLLLIARVAMTVYDNIHPPVASMTIAWKTPEDLAKKKDLLLDNPKKPILYWFTADWCEACKYLDATGFTDRTVVQSINDNFIPVIVTDRKLEDKKNTKVVQALIDRYSIYSLPTLKVVTGSGRDVDTQAGFMTVHGLQTFLRSSYKKADFERGVDALRKDRLEDAVKPFSDYLANKPDDEEDSKYATLYLSAAYIQLGKKEKARAVLDEALDKPKKDAAWPFELEHYLDYVQQRLTDSAEDREGRLTETHFFAAMRDLYNDKPADAVESLQWIMENGVKSYNQYAFASNTLKRLLKNSTRQTMIKPGAVGGTKPAADQEKSADKPEVQPLAMPQ